MNVILQCYVSLVFTTKTNLVLSRHEYCFALFSFTFLAVCVEVVILTAVGGDLILLRTRGRGRSDPLIEVLQGGSLHWVNALSQVI